MLVGSVQEKNSPPCGTQAHFAARGMKDPLECVLGGSVQSRGKRSRSIFHAFARATFILGASAGGDDPFSPGVRERAQQFKAGADPIQVFSRFPEVSWFGIPGKVKDTVRPHVADEFGGAPWIQQIGFVPRDVRKRFLRRPAAGQSMNFITLRYQQGHALPSNKPARSGY